MSANTFPAKIEPFKWAEQGYTWSGTLPLSRFVVSLVKLLDQLKIN
jgi:uncharacterized protein